MLVIQRSLVPDSGGPGRKRGGLSQIIRVRKLRGDDRPCQVGLYPSGVRVRICGLFGGAPGARGSAVIACGDGRRIDLETGGVYQLGAPDEHAELVLAGGSGFGDAWIRSFDDVQQDLDEELITPEGARRDYGCVVDEDGRIDRDASAALREEGRSGA